MRSIPLVAELVILSRKADIEQQQHCSTAFLDAGAGAVLFTGWDVPTGRTGADARRILAAAVKETKQSRVRMLKAAIPCCGMLCSARTVMTLVSGAHAALHDPPTPGARLRCLHGVLDGGMACCGADVGRRGIRSFAFGPGRRRARSDGIEPILLADLPDIRAELRVEDGALVLRDRESGAIQQDGAWRKEPSRAGPTPPTDCLCVPMTTAA